VLPPAPYSTLFPYTTLFRSGKLGHDRPRRGGLGIAEVLDQPVAVAVIPDVGEVRPYGTALAVDPMATGALQSFKQGPPSSDGRVGPFHGLEIAKGQPDQDEDAD